MRVDTDQTPSFADDVVAIPTSELDVLQEVISWDAIDEALLSIKGDYEPLSLFKMMLLQTWHNLSDAVSYTHLTLPTIA